MKTYTQTETREVRYIDIDDYHVHYDRLWDILDGLEDTSYDARILIDDTVLAKILEERGVIETSVRGSSYAGKNYEAFFKEFQALDES